MASIVRGLLVLAAFAAMGVSPVAAQTPSPAGAKVYIINLKDGAEVTSPFLVQFGLVGHGRGAGRSRKANTGHHHLLIDTQLTAEQMKEPNSCRRYPQAFRRRPDRSHGDAAAGQAHAATDARRLVAHSAFASGDVGADHDYGEVRNKKKRRAC